MTRPPPIDDRSDEALVAALNAGDTSAFDAVYYRYRDWVVRLAYRFTANNEDALDELQETFAYLFRKFPGFVLTARMTTFLYPVVKNLSLDGEFIQRDSLIPLPGDLANANLYVYVGGNPENAFDASGLEENLISLQQTTALQAFLQATFRNVLIGAAIGSLDAALSGGDPVEGAINGGLLGLGFTILGDFAVLRPALYLATTAIGAGGTLKALKDGNVVLAIERGTLTYLSVGAFLDVAQPPYIEPRGRLGDPLTTKVQDATIARALEARGWLIIRGGEPGRRNGCQGGPPVSQVIGLTLLRPRTAELCAFKRIPLVRAASPIHARPTTST